jgi:hypothetical protein
MREGRWAEAAARLFLTLGALLPYRLLLTFGIVYVTDDVFTSDIFNGELPARVLTGQLIHQGQIPLWTSHLCSGLPLTGVGEPIGLIAFSLLSPAAALDLFVIVLLLVAAHGAYALARRFGADRPGAVLAGLAFAGAGYIASQLRHLSIVSTVAWLQMRRRTGSSCWRTRLTPVGSRSSMARRCRLSREPLGPSRLTAQGQAHHPIRVSSPGVLPGLAINAARGLHSPAVGGRSGLLQPIR